MKRATPPVFGYLPARAVSAGDPLNVITQLALTATSSHPVMHDRTALSRNRACFPT